LCVFYFDLNEKEERSKMRLKIGSEGVLKIEVLING
jgi:hypothetical protein